MRIDRARVRIGIGSWADAEYTGLLYPKGLPAKERLTTYATWFDHVEVNASYYATPRREVVAEWAKQTPAGFTFDIKVHRAFSQSPEKTAREGDLVSRLLDSVQPLVEAKKLGAFLLVLPPSFGPGRHRLEELDALVEKLPVCPLAVELRHSDWIAGAQRDQTFDYFRARKLVWVAVDMPPIKGSTIMPPLDEVTHARLAYLRLHGRNKNWLKVKSAAERHDYDYGAGELEELAARITSLAEKADEVHVFANNHAHDFAPKAALALKALLQRAALR